MDSYRVEYEIWRGLGQFMLLSEQIGLENIINKLVIGRNFYQRFIDFEKALKTFIVTL